jgi:hypothetical protein
MTEIKIDNIYKHNAINILSKLNKKEVIRFKNFIKSPYFNRHRIIIPLFNELIKYYPSFNSAKLAKEKLRYLVSPSRSESTLRDSMSILFSLLKTFIGIEIYNNGQFPMKSNILKGLSEKRLFNIYEKTYRKYVAELEDVKKNSLTEYFINSYYTGQTRFDELLQIRGKRKTLLEEVNVQSNIFVNLANHFILQCFRTYYDLSTYKNIIDFDVNDLPVGKVVSGNGLTEIMKCIKTYAGHSYIFNIYKQLFDLKINGNDNLYLKYKKIIERYKDKMGRDELLFHNLELMDYCIKKDMTSFNDLFFARQLFEIYTFFLRKKMYMHLSNDNSLMPELYMNILINAVKLKKIKWLESFIKDYLKEVTASENENLEYISYAILYNSTGEYNKSQVYSFKIKERTKIALKIRRVIIIRNYVEMEMFEEALTEIENLKSLIKRTSLLSDLEKQKLNIFLKLAKKIVLFETGSSKLISGQLASEIRAFRHSWFYKSWLLKKAAEISG